MIAVSLVNNIFQNFVPPTNVLPRSRVRTERLLLTCVTNRISSYSFHTSTKVYYALFLYPEESTLSGLASNRNHERPEIKKLQ